MRLICPNCEATYEVPDDVIPEAGRDVQCSNCGDTWFQHHPDHEPPAEDTPAEETWVDATEETGEASDVTDGAGDDTGDTADTAEETPESPWDEGDSDDAGIDRDEAAEDQPQDEIDHDPAGEEMARRELDEGVKSILQEEAEREREARAAERASESLETQPDLGLAQADDEATRRSREAQTRMARLRGAPEPADTVAIDPTSRRDLLPDIEEINSSLRSDEDGDGAAMVGDAYPEAGTTPRSGGFRRGFLLIVLLAVIAALVYAFAPMISERFPAVADVLQSYVETVDGLRLWLDGQVRALMLYLDSMSSNAAS